MSGIDNLSDYYDVSLKEARLSELKSRIWLRDAGCDIADAATRSSRIVQRQKSRISSIHLAAQAGVRYSLDQSRKLRDEQSRRLCQYARSVPAHTAAPSPLCLVELGLWRQSRLPFRESDMADRPVSFYAATKRANEAWLQLQPSLPALPATGLRFFTVYGEWGRPDMALFPFRRSRLWRASRSRCSTAARWRGISPIAAMWRRRWSGLSACVPEARRRVRRTAIVNIAGGRRCALARFHRRARSRRSGARQNSLRGDAAGRCGRDLGRYVAALSSLTGFRAANAASPRASPGSRSWYKDVARAWLMQARCCAEKIDGRSARAGVIGLGYVGLPLAMAIARGGLSP